MMNVESHADQPIIIMRRTFRAPREIVWTALTDPKHVTKWFGGHGFANPVCEMDVRQGGTWRHTMRTPDGTEFSMEYVYLEVVRPEKLVWRNIEYGKAPRPGQLNVVNTVTLEDAGAETKWQLVALFDSIADRNIALEKGFTRVITQGSEKLEGVAVALHASRPEEVSVRSLAMGTFVPLLRNLSALLDKGAAHASTKGFDPEVLVKSRLAPDMFSLAKQVEYACFHAKDAAARLSGGTPPERAEPADSLGGMKERIEATIVGLEARPGALDGAADRAIVIDMPGGEMAFEMSGFEFLRDWAIPHFYFHVVTAYDILRHNGVAVGKRDYLAGVGRYLRPRKK
jgi:hypothetical protein